jgi:hypothetical protein
LIVVDGVEGKEYDGYLKGTRPVFDSPSQLHTLALRGGEFLRVEVEIVMPGTQPSGGGPTSPVTGTGVDRRPRHPAPSGRRISASTTRGLRPWKLASHQRQPLECMTPLS